MKKENLEVIDRITLGESLFKMYNVLTYMDTVNALGYNLEKTPLWDCVDTYLNLLDENIIHCFKNPNLFNTIGMPPSYIFGEYRDKYFSGYCTQKDLIPSEVLIEDFLDYLKRMGYGE